MISIERICVQTVNELICSWFYGCSLWLTCPSSLQSDRKHWCWFKRSYQGGVHQTNLRAVQVHVHTIPRGNPCTHTHVAVSLFFRGSSSDSSLQRKSKWFLWIHIDGTILLFQLGQQKHLPCLGYTRLPSFLGSILPSKLWSFRLISSVSYISIIKFTSSIHFTHFASSLSLFNAPPPLSSHPLKLSPSWGKIFPS